jgi:hypothetical protein
MAKINTPVKQAAVYTHEGGQASRIDAMQELQRSVMACLLWEDQFYESGVTIADRIAMLVPQVKPQEVSDMAITAREKMKLRHVPLLLVYEMTKHESHRGLVKSTLARVIQRADELTEFVAIYWKDGRHPLSAQVKKGLAEAFHKFNAYELAKYNRDSTVKLRDVLFMVHPRPKDEDQEALWKALVDGNLASPDTWEVALSAGQDKRETWTRLLQKKKLGALAFLRNLRNMQAAGVDEDLIRSSLNEMKTERVLPFRFIAAARAVPPWERWIEPAMLKCLAGQEKLNGKTALVIDVSGSMNSAISKKSDLQRYDAANGLAILCKELADVAVYSFSNELKVVPDRSGFALADAIKNSQPHGGTYLAGALKQLPQKYERVIVITDEQSHDGVIALPDVRGYLINVASNKNGVGYEKGWTHINGWSEAVFDYMREIERALLP